MRATNAACSRLGHRWGVPAPCLLGKLAASRERAGRLFYLRRKEAG